MLACATSADLTTSKLNGGVFTFTNSAGTAVTITVGTAPSAFNPVTKTAQVQSVDQLNQALADAGVNLSAVITGPDSLTFTSTNDGAGQVITGTAAPAAPVTLDAINISANAAGGGAGGAVVAAVPDPASQTARATLVTQYNQIITQLTTTAQDASFNGINLLDGNSLKMIFDETGKSTLTIAGVTFNPAGLGLASLAPGTDFTDNVLTSKVLTALNNASLTLRTQASAFGANLSIVQIRQDFSKKLINVLQTGSANLTLADATRKRPTARRCRPASRSRYRRWRSPTSRSRASCSSCADFVGSSAGFVTAAGLCLAAFSLNSSSTRSARAAHGCAKENGGAKAPPFSFAEGFAGSAQQLKDALLRLVGERQRRGRDRLAGRQRLAVGRFLVGVGQRQRGRTGLQHVDQVLVEVLADLHDRQVGAEGRGLRAQRDAGGVERRQHGVGRRRCR